MYVSGPVVYRLACWSIFDALIPYYVLAGSRRFIDGWFVDWSGYSFASGHTIGATLLYGQLLLFLLPLMKSKRWQRLTILSAAMLVMLVGFSRIALGAHYLSDVIAAIFLGVLWLMICALLLRPMRRSMVLPVAVGVEDW